MEKDRHGGVPRRWGIPVLAGATALVAAGMAFAAGPATGSSAGAASGGTSVPFEVGGVQPGAVVDVFALTPAKSGSGGWGQLAAGRVATSSGGQLTLTLNHAPPGAYVAVEFLPGDVLVSNVASSGSGAPESVQGGYDTASAHVISPPASFTPPVAWAAPGARLSAPALVTDSQAGTLNGPTCGSLSVQQVGSDAGGHAELQATWSGCSQLVADQFVVLIGAAPLPGGGNPFDNPPTVWGFWYGYVRPDNTVVIGLGDHNTLLSIGDPNYYFPADEWFDMSIFSSNVEAPAGQLPEVPFAAALPLVAVVPLLWGAARRRVSR